MTKIYSYKKFITPEITRTLLLPTDENLNFLGTELATIGGTTYVSIPDNATLPDNQPIEIKNGITVVTMTDDLKLQIKAVSPHAQLIAQRVIEKIRDRYTVDDELYLARIGVGQSSGIYTPAPSELQQLADYAVYVEDVRQWGRDQRALLGL